MNALAPSPAPLRIGALAAAADVSVQALRYYERRGLIAPIRRRESGYREYATGTIEQVRFIRHAQQMGFRLAEIDELLRLRRRVAHDGGKDADAVRAAVQAKRDDVTRRMAQLEAIGRTLDGLLETCDQMCHGSRPPAECPIFEAIDHAATPGSIAPAPRATRSGGRARSATHHPRSGESD